MADLDHTYGGDLSASASGDLLTADGLTESEQRVLRRLLTCPGDYLWHPDYGAGLPTFVGKPINIRQITALILSQMKLEASVSQSPAPTVTVTPITNGLSATITYTEITTGQSTTLSFDVTP